MKFDMESPLASYVREIIFDNNNFRPLVFNSLKNAGDSTAERHRIAPWMLWPIRLQVNTVLDAER